MKKRLCANGDCQEDEAVITLNYYDDERPAFCSEECAVEWLQRRIEVKDRNADARRAQSYLATGPLVLVEDMTPPVRVVFDDDQ
jgi:TfoX/Sxy family transcriptional regulator of competence genes